MIGGHIFAKPHFYEPTISAGSFSWSRNLSSQAGASGDCEEEPKGGFSDLEPSSDEDWFSDLETPPETADVVADKEEVVADKEDIVADKEDVVSDVEPDETVDSELGLSDVETETSGEKKATRSDVTSALFKVLMDTSWVHVNSALDKWVSDGKPLGRSEISMVMLNLRRRRFYGKALQFYGWLEANKRLDFDERDYASHLDLIAKVHGIQKAKNFIEKIPPSFKSEVIYRTLLANCVASGDIKKSEEVFNQMRDLSFPITTFACNQLLLLYKRNDRKKIADVLKLMEKENVKPSVFTYRLLIDTKGRASDIQGMEDLVEMMKAEGLEPDVGIRAMLARYYIYGGFTEKAEAELKKIEGDDIKENRTACKELLPLYAALGKADEVGRIWKVCETNARLEECLAAIEAWGKLGMVENAEKIFEHMMKTWNKLSPRYYNALIKVYANNKLLTKGKDLAKRMSENGCRIGPLTWDALVKLYVEAGEVEKADAILQKATQQNKTRPLYNSYIAVLDKYAKRGDVHNSEKMFHKLRQNGYMGRMRLYELLLQAYVNAKVPAYGFRERMKADNMFPSKAVAAQLAAVDAFKRTEISDLLD